jgi:UDP-N-acetyl-D-mannosaminuronic acid dehydrogenase
MTLSTIQKKINNKSAKIGLVGLGYVGLPVACVFAQAGFDLVGVDLLAERVDAVNAGVSPVEGDEPGLSPLLADTVAGGKLRASIEYQSLRDRDIVLIAVETPVDENHKPTYQALRAALESLGPVLKSGALVIVESTLAPGTMRDLVRPTLEKSSQGTLNQDFYLGHCPERVMPGKLLANLRSVNRVLGGMTPETAETMVKLYSQVVDADLDPTDCLTAELVKTTENAYRDVNIAFANEVALVCETLGGDVWQVRQLVNKSPGRKMLFPGAGVGGHCIPKDPWLLITNVGDDVKPGLIPAARAINDGMPSHMVDLTADALQEVGVELADARVAVLGSAYLENSDDVRNSPSADLIERLRNRGVRVVIHDPCVREYRGDLEEKLQGCDAAVLMVAHDQYRQLPWAELKSHLRHPVLIDGRHVVTDPQEQAPGFLYRGVGQSQNTDGRKGSQRRNVS